MNQHPEADLGRLVLKRRKLRPLAELVHFIFGQASRETFRVARASKHWAFPCFPRIPSCIVLFIIMTLGDRIPCHGSIPCYFASFANIATRQNVDSRPVKLSLEAR